MIGNLVERAYKGTKRLVYSKVDRDLERAVRVGGKTLFLGFTGWKRDFYKSIFPNLDILFVGEEYYNGPRLTDAVFDCVRDCDIYVWSYKDPYWLAALAANNNNTICRAEDGFLRSVGLGAQRIRPRSIIIEQQGDLYFHKSRSSSLHALIRNLSEDQREDFQRKGSELKRRILDNNLTKYNFKATTDRLDIVKDSVFVVGQVERDESIRRGPEPFITSENLIERVREENPDATIYFKQHPEVHKGIAEPYSAPLRRFPDIVEFPQHLNMFSYVGAFRSVYTISSLVGFEMLLRGAQITTFGAPWYAGWNLTDDRSVAPENVDGITPEILLWAGYGEYPLYFSDSSEPTDVFAVTDSLSKQLQS